MKINIRNTAAIFAFTLIISTFVRFGFSEASEKIKPKTAYMPDLRSNPAVVTNSDGMIYVIGGNDYDGGTNSTWLFEPKKNLWFARKSMPEKLFAHSAVFLDGRVYIIGGMKKEKGKIVFSNKVFEYSEDENKWSEKSPMSLPRARFGVCVIDSKIYVAGGINSENEGLKVLEMYDPAKDKWTRLKDVPTGRNRLSTAASNSLLYAFGGCRADKGEALKVMEVYHPDRDEWEKAKDMPTARKNFASFENMGKIYAVAGWDQVKGKTRFLDSGDVYDVKTGTWSSFKGNPIGRDGARAVAVGDRTFIFGGYNGKILDLIEIFPRSVNKY